MATKKKITKKKAAPKKAPKKKSAKLPAVPAGFRTVTPHIIVSPCLEAMELYKKAFGAKTVRTMEGMGKVMHAEMKIGDSIVMLSDEMGDMPGTPPREIPRQTPKNAHASTGGVMLYVNDVDKWHDRAVAAGCTTSMPPSDQFWGDRYAQVEDPFGHVWAIATQIKKLTTKQMNAAMAKMSAPLPSSDEAPIV